MGCNAVQLLNLLVVRFHGHFLNKQCADGDIFMISKAKQEAALVGLREAGYVAAEGMMASESGGLCHINSLLVLLIVVHL